MSELTPKPSLFVLGTGRSGTTIIFKMLASHPDLGWFSNYAEQFPRAPQLAVLARLLEPWCHGRSRAGLARLLPIPKEAVSIPRAVTRGWFSQKRNVPAAETPQELVEAYRQYIAATLRWQGKSRFIHKHTGFARAAFLSAVDPRGRFLHVVRDGRAVVDSLLRVPWWSGDLDSWWWGDMPQEYAETYAKSGKDPVILATLVWLRLTQLIEADLAELDVPRMTLRYDRFVSAPMEHLEAVSDFAGLEFSTPFRRRLERFEIRDGDSGWQRRLGTDQVRAIDALAGERLAAYGFAV